MKSLEKLKALVENSTPLNKGERLLVAVSGGPDSQVLLHMMIELGYTNLIVAHVNYKRRNLDSDLDQACAEAWTNNLGIPFHKKEIIIDDEKGNFQNKARALRYAWFDQLISDLNIDYLLTAHHKNDQHETLAMRFFSGSRGRGLTGIPIVSGNRIRPLLCLTKTEILEYAQLHNVPYRTDHSNTESHYLRNFFRNEIFPLLNQTIQGLTNRLDTTQKNLVREQLLLSHFCYYFISQHTKWRESTAIISLEELREDYLRIAFICFVLNVNENQAAQVLKAKKKKVFKFLDWKASLFSGNLWVEPRDKTVAVSKLIDASFPVKIKLPFGNVTGKITHSYQKETNPSIEFIPMRNNQQSMRIESWKEGDRIQIINGHKKVSDLLNEENLSPLEKEKVCCLWVGDQLLWVIGIRLSTAAYAKKKDTSFLKLRYEAPAFRKKTIPEIKKYFENKEN